MDANDTRYHLLLGRDDWGACLVETKDGLVRLSQAWDISAIPPITLPPGWDTNRLSAALAGVEVPEWRPERDELTLNSHVFLFNKSPKDVTPRLADRRGAGGDVYGNLYFIADDERGILVKSSGSGRIAPFWSVEDALAGPSQENDGSTGGFKALEPHTPAPARLRGLAVTSQHYLLVGALPPDGQSTPAGLLIFDLHAGGPPVQLVWPEPPPGIPSFMPFDMAPTPDGGVWILDRALVAPQAARLWRLNRNLQVVVIGGVIPTPTLDGSSSSFQALDGSSSQSGVPCLPQVPLDFDAARLVRTGDAQWVNGLAAVEALPDGTALILDNSGDPTQPRYSQILRFTLHGQLLGEPISTRTLQERVDKSLRDDFSLLGHDFAFQPKIQEADSDSPEAIGKLLIVAQDGNQSYAFRVDEGASPIEADGSYRPVTLSALPLYMPMRLFGGRSLVVGEKRVYYDLDATSSTGEAGAGALPSSLDWVPLVEQKRPRYDTEVTFYTPLRDPFDQASAAMSAGSRPAFDSGIPDCVWHRLMIDACVHTDSLIEVWSRAANTEGELTHASWQSEPALYRRGDGAEIPFLPGQDLSSSPDEVGADQQELGTFEFLFQKARGRFLQLRIRLSGNGRVTPSLRALRAYYPRFSYLKEYLPAVYQADAISASFMERYLANLEGMYTTLEDRIATVQALFDVRTIPAGYLDWLAGWFGVVLDPTWDENRRRLFLAHAPELFNQRGTLSGVARAVRLATDSCPDECIFIDESATGDTSTLSMSRLASTPVTKVCRQSGTVRIVEAFRTRHAPGVVFGDPSQIEGPGLTAQALDWTPAQGAAPLHARYRQALEKKYEKIDKLNQAWGSDYLAFELIELPPLRPEGESTAVDWEWFLRAELGFTYAPVDEQDLPVYQAFLARRYGHVTALNQTYGLVESAAYTAFEQVSLPNTLPEGGERLHDWIQFVSLVVPMRSNAHRFVVLVPTVTGAQTEFSFDLLDRVRQVVELVKPSHTTFDVKEYWAMFRVGEARLGLDTLVDLGSRLAAVVLDETYLAQGYLNYSHPWQVTNRVVLGRERVARSAQPVEGMPPAASPL